MSEESVQRYGGVLAAAPAGTLVAFSPDGELVAVGDADGAVYIWNLRSVTPWHGP
jgi:WD40 repeat protein